MAGTYGHLTLNANGSYSYTADLTSNIDSAATGSHPVDTFTYTVSDGLGGVTSSTVSFTIDRAPTVAADTGAAVESSSGTGNVLTNDSDKDGDTLTVSAVNGVGGNVGTSVAGTYGHITINSNGSYTYNADSTAAIDGGATGSHLTDTFTYTANDGHGGTTTTNIVITLDRPPTVAADTGTAVESSSGTGNVLTNDSDRDSDTLTVSAVNGVGGNVGASVAGTYGHITINSNGSYTYNADKTSVIDGAATGSHLTDTFSYAASDGHGGTTTTNIVVTLDRAPTVVADTGAAVESASGTGNVLTNDSDRDGDTLAVAAVNGVAGNVGASVAGVYGHITIHSDGSYTYNADNTAAIDGAANGSHLTDTFTYTANDGQGGTTTANIVITLDRAPTVTGDTSAAAEGSASTGNVLTFDTDRDGDVLRVTQIGGSAVASGGAGTIFAGNYGHLTMHQDGSFTYDADNTAAIDGAATGSHPTDTFTYTADDGHGGTSTANLVVTVDRAPVVTADSNNAVESGAAVTGNVVTNDSDPDGDTLAVTAVNGSGPGVGASVATTYGHIQINANGSYTYSADNTAAINGGATGSHLTDTVSYTAFDGVGAFGTANLTITIDRAPVVVASETATVFAANTATGTAGIAGTGALDGDSDADGDTLTVTKVGATTVAAGGTVFDGTYGHPDDAPGRQLQLCRRQQRGDRRRGGQRRPDRRLHLHGG